MLFFCFCFVVVVVVVFVVVVVVLPSPFTGFTPLHIRLCSYRIKMQNKHKS